MRLDVSVLVLGALVCLLAVVALMQGGVPRAADGIRQGVALFVSIFPQLGLGFVLAGLVTVLLPREALASVVGSDSGLPGLFLATIAGLATPGGPFVQFPLVAALAGSGAGTGPIAAYLTAWSLISWNRVLVWELPLLGPNFTLARWLVSLALPVIVGLLVPPVSRLLGGTRP